MKHDLTKILHPSLNTLVSLYWYACILPFRVNIGDYELKVIYIKFTPGTY